MENNYSTLNTKPVTTESGLAILFIDTRSFIDLVKLQQISQTRLIDDNYKRQDSLDYLLAISG